MRLTETASATTTATTVADAHAEHATRRSPSTTPDHDSHTVCPLS